MKQEESKHQPFAFEIYGKVFEHLKPFEHPQCMYLLSAQTVRELIKFVIEEVKQ